MLNTFAGVGFPGLPQPDVQSRQSGVMGVSRDDEGVNPLAAALSDVGRGLSFWSQAVHIYGSFKVRRLLSIPCQRHAP